MKRFFGPLLVLGLLFLGHSLTPARAQGNPTDEVLRLVNQVRAEFGLAPVTYNVNLAAAAQGHANFIAQNAIYSHIGINGSTWQDRAVAAGYEGWAGENLVGGAQLTPQQGVTWWRNSAIHFSNMLNPKWTEAGVGFSVGNNQNFYVMVFGDPGDAGFRTRAAERVVDVPFIVAPIELSAPREDGSIVHTVQQGHTFWAIAARYEVPLSDLYLFNGLNEDSFLNPGDELVIRLAEGQVPPPTPTPPASHVVREGESLWTIAANYQTDLATILWLNALPEDAVVHPGNEVRVRLVEGEEPPPTATPQIMHVVESGDTLWSIALQHGLTLDQLLAFNGIADSELLQIGQQLLIREPTPIPSPTPPATPTVPSPTADAAALAALFTPTPTASPQPTAVAEVPAGTPTAGTGGRGFGFTLGIGAMVAGLLLTAAAGVAIMIMWRGDK